jgi:hypothetical protein
VADYLVSTHGFHKHAFALPIKQACQLTFQLDDEAFEGENKENVVPNHGMTPRQMMQLVGTDMFRTMVHKDFWIRHFLTFYHKMGKDQDLVVCDVRFQNEVDVIKNLGGTVIRITRKRTGTGEGRHTVSDKHISEQGIDSLEHVDMELNNDGTLEELRCQLQNWGLCSDSKVKFCTTI